LQAQLKAKTQEVEELSRALAVEKSKVVAAPNSAAAARAAAASAAVARDGASAQGARESVAILGMGCRFPKSPDLDSFWHVLDSKTDAASEVPSDRWNINQYFDADMEAPGKIYVREGGFIENIDLFDPEFFGISPREAVSMDPQQRVLLETAYEALEDANVNADTLENSSTGVYVGVSHSDYRTIQVHGDIANIDHMYGTGTSTNVIAGRLSYILGMQGPALAVDTACSSSLVALHLALASISSGESTMALAGGVHIMISPELMVNLCRARMLSPEGRCKTFDQEANGYGRGEGCGVLAAKSLSKSLADQDNIRAIVRGSAINQDGKSSGLTAPNGPSQQSVMRQALAAGSMEALDVGYVEAHGTATPLGDPIEVQALGVVYGKKRAKGSPFVIGAVKSNIGHLESSSGSAGLIKLVLVLESSIIPPNVHFNTLNKKISLERARAVVPTKPTPFPAGRVRAAGVSSFGFSGTNSHIVLEQAPAAAGQADYSTKSPGNAWDMFTLTAKSEGALRSLAGRYAEFISGTDKELGDIINSIQATRSLGDNRLAVPALNTTDLSRELLTYAAGKDGTLLSHGKLSTKGNKMAMLFTGQGSQYVNMGRDLYNTEPVFRTAIDNCAEILRPLLEHDLLAVLWGTAAPAGAPPVNTDVVEWLGKLNLEFLEPKLQSIGVKNVADVLALKMPDIDKLDLKLIHKRKITKAIESHKTGKQLPTLSPMKPTRSTGTGNQPIDETAYTQPAIFSVEYALAMLWMSWGVIPNAVMGHSVGEYVAACVAGVFSLEDGLKLIAARAKLMDSVPREGNMAAIFAQESVVVSAIASYSGVLAIAAVNGPQMVVISGRKSAVTSVIEALKADGIRAQELNTSNAFHSPLMDPILQEFERVAASVTYAKPKIAMVLNRTGKICDFALDAKYWRDHLRNAVRFLDSLKTLEDAGYGIFLEVGPQPVLTGMAKRCIPSGTFLPSMMQGKDKRIMLKSAGGLFANCCKLDLSKLDPFAASRQIVKLPTYTFNRQSYWVDVKGGSSGGGGQSLPGGHSKVVTPLLGMPIPVSGMEEQVFMSEFNVVNLKFLGDHVLHHVVVVPGAAYISMAMSGVVELHGHSQVFVLEDVVFPQAMVLPEAVKGRPAQIIFSSLEEESEFEFYSLDVEEGDSIDEDSWVLHTTGSVNTRPPTPPSPKLPAKYLEPIKARCTKLLTKEVFYQRMWDREYHLGPMFQWVGDVWHNSDDEAFSQFRIPVGTEASEFEIFPGLIDSCFQLVAATFFDNVGGSTYIPFQVDHFYYYAHPAEVCKNQTLWAHAKESSRSDDGHVLHSDVNLFGEDGTCVMRVVNLHLKKAGGDALIKRVESGAQQSMYDPSWKAVRCDKSAPPVAEEPSSWLVFGDQTNSDFLMSGLRERGHTPILVSFGPQFARISDDTFTINPTAGVDYEKLLEDSMWEQLPACVGIIHAWCTDISSDIASSFDPHTSLDNGCQSVLMLIQKLSQAMWSPSPRVYLLTRGTQAIGIDAVVPGFYNQSLWGMANVLQVEHPELRTVRIDLDVDSAQDHKVMDDILTVQTDCMVALRKGNRLVNRLARSNTKLAEKGKILQLTIPVKGVIDNLTYVEIPRPVIDDDQIEVQSIAAGMNFRDLLNVLDMYPGPNPGPLGGEGSGKVVAVGKNVKNLKVGDDVFGVLLPSLAQYTHTYPELVTKKPVNISHEEASSITVTYMTAHYGFVHLAKIKKSDKVLIHSSAGGVGIAALQIAKMYGCEIFGTASNPKKHAVSREYGATHMGNSRTLDFADEFKEITNGEGVDVILNTLNNEFIPKSLEILKQGGRFIEIGKAGVWTKEQMKAYRPDVQFWHFDLVEMWETNKPIIKQMFDELTPDLAAGRLKPLPITIFPFTEADKAFRYMSHAKHIGKIVITHRASTGAEFRPDGCYVLTGGFGGLGMLVANWMVDHGAKHLTLLGRRGMPADAGADVAALEAKGAAVTSLVCDVGSDADVKQMVSTVSASGFPLRGIMHAAGFLRDALIDEQDWAQFQAVMAPKVSGGWSLHQHTLGVRTLDFLTLFSSASAIIGNLGQSNYASANAFLDGLAAYRCSIGEPGLSINWGPWAEVGMASTVDAGAVSRWNEGGISLIMPDDGLTILERAMSGTSPQLVVLDIKWKRYGKQIEPGFEQPMLADLLPKAKSKKSAKKGISGKKGAGGGEAGSEEAAGIMTELAATPVDLRLSVLKEFITVSVVRVLVLDPNEDFDTNRPLTELGMDSLMVRELSNALSGGLGIKLPVTLAYDYPNVESMATFILSKLKIKEVADVPAPKKTAPAPASAKGATKAAPTASKSPASPPLIVAAGTATVSTEPLAVLGMSCRMPMGADTPDAFWEKIANGVDCIVQVPNDRWDIDNYYDADKAAPGKMNSRFGGFLDQVNLFDPLFFGISPKEAKSMDPQQRLLMETAWECMENAGRAPTPNVPEIVGVFVGATTFDYQLRKARMPVGEVDSFWGTGSSNSVTAGRMSYTFGYQGPCMAVDTACSSALVAMDLACKSVRTGSSTSALAGGVSLLIEPDLSINFAKAGMLSPDGRCHTFDAGANGYVRGEGCGMMFVERESVARSSSSHIFCLVRGSAINQDGRVSGLTVPNGPSQQAVIKAALADGSVDRQEIGLVEAHGTGTPLGDPIEVNSLVATFGEGRTLPLIIGAVKTNIGHLEGGAGIAGLLKLALCVDNGTVPPNLHFKKLNPSIELEDVPIVINSKMTPWPVGYSSKIGGVSSFGFSGTNGHVIIEGVTQPADVGGDLPRSRHVLAIAAFGQPALSAMAGEVADYLDSNLSVRVADVCHALNLRGSFNNRLALVVNNDVAAVAAGLRNYAATEATGSTCFSGMASEVGRNIAVIFADDATLAVNEECYVLVPAYQEAVDACDAVNVPGRRGGVVKARADAFAAHLAAFRMWRSLGIDPVVVAGTGLGEWVAAHVAGILDLDDALRLCATSGDVSSATPSRPTMGYVNCRTGKIVGSPASDGTFAPGFGDTTTEAPGAVTALSKLGTLVFLEIGSPSASPMQNAFRAVNGMGSKRVWFCTHEDGNDWNAIAVTVAKMHSVGVAINWQALDSKYEFNFLPLPTYPFQRQRYWLDAVGQVSAGCPEQLLSVTKAIGEPVNLLLGQQMSSPFVDDVIFVSHASIVTAPVLEDHIINDLCIVPAVFQVGMALEAAVHLANGRSTQVLEDLVIPAALLLKGNASKSVHLVLKPTDDDNQLSFELNSIGDGDENEKSSWQTHASGKMRTDAPKVLSTTHETPSSIKRRCDIEHTREQFYEFMWAREYELGPMFQLVEHIWRNDREAVCKLSRYSSDDAVIAESSTLYPVYFDCCIQLMMAVVAWDTPLVDFLTYVPLGCGTFNLYQTSLGKDLFCHTDISKSAGGDRLDSMDVITADLTLLDENGGVVAEAINFRVKRAGKELLMNSLKEDLSGWFYDLLWDSAELGTESSDAGSSIVFTDQTTGPQLCTLLKSANEKVITVTAGNTYAVNGSSVVLDPKKAAHYAKLLDEDVCEGCARIVHMWSMDSCANTSDPTAAQLAHATDMGTYSALYLTQALASSSLTPRLYLVTQGTQPVGGSSSELAVAQSPLWGFGKVVGLEFPALRCTRLDMDLQDSHRGQQIFDEISAKSEEEEVGYRAGTRYVSRLVQRKKDKGGSLKVSAEGSYLITGGYGGLGLLVAEFLVDHGATNLILTSRRGVPAAEPPVLQKLRDKGATITAGKADVADEASLRKVFEAAKGRGQPVRGVVHSAGVLDDKKLVDMDLASFEMVMASKVAGARNLHELTKDTDHDMFVLFSSATSAIGNVGQSNYAAANAYLDSLAHHRASKNMPGLSINWGPWAEVGMAADPSLKAILGGIGVDLIPPDSGMQALETALVAEAPQFVTVRIGWSKYLDQYSGGVTPAIFSTVATQAEKTAPKKKKKDAAGSQELINKLSAVPDAKRGAILSQMLQAQAMSVLGVSDPSAVAMNQPLSELGLDSMLAVELRNELTDMVGANLSATLLFDYPTIEAISGHLLEDILQISDASGGGETAGAMSAEQMDKLRGDPIAILGMSCRMPGGGNTPAEFWQTLSPGAILTSKVPASTENSPRWDHDWLYDTDDTVPGKTFTDQGGFVTCGLALFDAQFFGIAKREAEFMDPAQRMLLEVTWEALEIAGLAPDAVLGTRTGTYTGLCACDYQLLETKSGNLEPMTGLYGTGNSHAVAAGRLAYTLGAKGPAFSVDTACSSALIAAHLGCMDLRNGITNMGLGGGVHMLLAPDLWVNFAKAHMLSPNGRCATFDEKADGFCRAEGSCMVVLKRLKEAETDGNPIQALMHGSATNQDGRSNSLTAPNGPSQQMCITDALAMGGVAPNIVSYLECHGTGTSLGDPIEVQAAGNILGEGRDANSPIFMGSVKAAIGHLEAAAGISGLCKILMCMKAEALPMQPHYKILNPMINIDTIPAAIPTEYTPWKGVGNRLIAGVSSFGFGGSNAHANLEKYNTMERMAIANDRPVSVLPLSATSEAALQELAEKYSSYFSSADMSPLPDLCYTAATGRNHFAYRLAVSCDSTEELKAGLAAYTSGKKVAQTCWGRSGDARVAMLFTGQGSQYAGMGAELYETQPVFRDSVDECAKLLAGAGGIDVELVPMMYPATGAKSPIDETKYTQPALFAFEYSLAQLWMAWGVEPAAVMGHSVGEYVAACIAGCFSLEDGLKLISARARLMDSVPREGSMAAVMADAATVGAALKAYPTVDIAGVNGPQMVVISGKKAEVARVLQDFTTKKVRSMALNTSNAFHSAAMDPIMKDFEKVAAGITYSDPYTPFILNRTGKAATGAPNAAYWCDHMRNAVLFKDSIETCEASGYQIFLEIGPDPVLTGMARRCVKSKELKMLPSVTKKDSDWKTMCKTMSELYVAGADIKWASFDKPYDRHKVFLPTYAFQRSRYWHDNCDLADGTGLHVPASQAGFRPRIDLDDILYSVEWNTQALANTTPTGTPAWLLLCDQQGVGEELAAQISQSGSTVAKLYARETQPLSEAALAAAVKSATSAFAGAFAVVDLWSLDAAPVQGLTAGALEDSTVLACGHAAYLAKALAGTQATTWFATRGGQAVQPGPVEIAQGPMWGFARTISLEYPEIWGGLVDLDPAADVKAQAAALLNEVRCTNGEDHIGFRGGDRYVMRVVADAGAGSAKSLSLKADKTYLVTGGFGGVLKEVCRWMVAQGAKHLVLTSRGGNRDPEFVQELEKAGAAVEVAAVDVSDAAGMSVLMNKLKAGAEPLGGVVHGAGVLTTELIESLSLDDIAKVLKPKTVGSWNLHTLTEGVELDFFVLFSSISAAWGSAQLAHYGAANQFLDVLAHHRHSLGLPATSIDWGLLESGGMSSHDNIAASAAMGLKPVRIDQITGVLGSLARDNVVQRVVVNVEWKKFKGLYDLRGTHPLLKDVGGGGGAKAHSGPSQLIVDLLAAEPDARRALILAFVSSTAGDILGFDDSIDVDRGLFELGFDSLSAIDFKTLMEEQIGTDLPSTLAFDYPSLDAIVTYLTNEVMPRVLSAAASGGGSGGGIGGSMDALAVVTVGGGSGDEAWTVLKGGQGVLIPQPSAVLQSMLTGQITAKELDTGLADLAAGRPARLQTSPPNVEPPRVAMMFTGQGSQSVGMGKQLYETELIFKKTLDACDALLAESLGCSLVKDVIYGTSDMINETKYTQPVLFSFEYSLAQVWLARGLRPAAVMGHSVGEYVAACVAGVFSLEEGLRLIAMRADLMGNIKAGGVMVAVFAGKDQVAPLVAPHAAEVSIAAVNGPGLTVVSGKKETVAVVVGALGRGGVKSMALEVSDAFHSPLMAPMLEMFGMVTGMVGFAEPTIPMVSCVSGALATPGQVTNGDYWVQHVPAGVDFYGGVQTLVASEAGGGAGCSVLLEIGPTNVLEGMAKRCFARGSPELARLSFVPSLVKGQDDEACMRKAAAKLYAVGADMAISAIAMEK
jgi:acyl transferase domain-containing protein/D-arabinose 1-dehydrogenase-like Zn-dependent alcohol dehydrogenase/acyl carrier protein